MMPLRASAIAAACLTLCGVTALAAEPATVLKHNPFSRPDVAVVTAGSQAPSAGTFEPVLRATLAAGASSLANVDGVMLGIGEQIGGYTLVRVGEGLAEFTNGDRHVTLLVRADTTSETQ